MRDFAKRIKNSGTRLEGLKAALEVAEITTQPRGAIRELIAAEEARGEDEK